MPPLDETEVIEDSSASVDLDDLTTETVDTTTDGDGAASSTANDETVSKDTLSVVRDVVDPARKAQADAAASSAEGEDAGSKAGDPEPKPQDDENYSDVPFHKHPRFQHLLREKKAAEIEAVEYRKVTGFLEQNGLTRDEAADALLIAAHTRNDPEKAWELLKPIVQGVLTAIGEIVPDDIAARVHSGEITRETALELSKARAKGTSLEDRQKRDSERRKADEERRHGESLRDTALSWVEDRKLKDPAFDAKFELLQREVAWLQTKDGKPNTIDGVKAQLKKAYDNVNASYTPPKAAARPSPKPMKPPQGGSVASAAAPEPKSTVDIINQVVGQRAA